jgi:hypothetical protein
MEEGTWNRLNVEQQGAVRALSKQFIKAVQASGTGDGWAFAQRYFVKPAGTEFVITDGFTPLPGIRHSDKAVLKALLTDAVQNYGR